MHGSSLINMSKFVDKYLDKNSRYKILDFGSQNVQEDKNAIYRKLFDSNPLWQYFGCDMADGYNVDIVLKKVYEWKEIKSNSFDCVISGQALEHVEFFWLTFLEIKRVMKHGGICCIIVPSSGPEHKYPIDCYRYYPDGLRAVAKYVGLEVLEVYTQWDSSLYPEMDAIWKDSVIICKKPQKNIYKDLKFFIKSKLIRFASRGVIK